MQNTALPRYLPQVLIEQPGTALRPVECRIVSHRICGEPPCTLPETNRAAVRCFLKREPLKGFPSGLVSRPCGAWLPRLRLVYIVTSKNTEKNQHLFRVKFAPAFASELWEPQQGAEKICRATQLLVLIKMTRSVVALLFFLWVISALSWFQSSPRAETSLCSIKRTLLCVNSFSRWRCCKQGCGTFDKHDRALTGGGGGVWKSQ